MVLVNSSDSNTWSVMVTPWKGEGYSCFGVHDRMHTNKKSNRLVIVVYFFIIVDLFFVIAKRQKVETGDKSTADVVPYTEDGAWDSGHR